MKTRHIPISEAERQALLKALHTEQPPHATKRLTALKMRVLDGMSSREAARLCGLHVSTLNKLLKRYQEGGIAALATKRPGHGARYMTQEEETRFLASFQAREATGQVIDVSEVHRAYEEAVGHPVTRSAIYYLLHKHGWHKGIPQYRGPRQKGPPESHSHGHKQGASTGDTIRRGWICSKQ